MRIAYISTFPPIECGIATYTQFLSEAVARQEHEVHIVSEEGAQGHNVYPTYTKDSGSLSRDIFDMSVKVTPDLVHIQHEFGLFGGTCGAGLDLSVQSQRNSGGGYFSHGTSGTQPGSAFNHVHDVPGAERGDRP